MKELMIIASLLVCATLGISQEDECLEGDCKNGFGILKCACGYTFEGIFEEGEKVSGKIIKPKLTYTGPFKDDMAHGIGVMETEDGARYEGMFHLSQPDSFGTFYLKSGHVYEGYVSYWSYMGAGMYYSEDSVAATKDVRIGNFENDQLNGLGFHFDPNGDFFIGELYKGRYDGVGMYFFRDSQVEFSRYKRGKVREDLSIDESFETQKFSAEGERGQLIFTLNSDLQVYTSSLYNEHEEMIEELVYNEQSHTIQYRNTVNDQAMLYTINPCCSQKPVARD